MSPCEAGNCEGPSLVPCTGLRSRFREGELYVVSQGAVHHIDPYRLPAGKIASLIDFEAATPVCAGEFMIESQQ